MSCGLPIVEGQRPNNTAGANGAMITVFRKVRAKLTSIWAAVYNHDRHKDEGTKIECLVQTGLTKGLL